MGEGLRLSGYWLEREGDILPCAVQEVEPLVRASVTTCHHLQDLKSTKLLALFPPLFNPKR